jgi:hypothetical protein
LSNVEEYKKFHEVNNKFYSEIIKSEFLSSSHHSVLEIENKYKINPILGYFQSNKNAVKGLDERKAYTECLMSINKIGIFDYFDIYKKYENEPLDDLTYYIVEVQNITNDISILFKDKISRTLGFILKAIPSTEYKILYHRQPCDIKDVDFKKPVNDLYKTNLTENFKKQIVNRVARKIQIGTTYRF